MAEDGKIVYKFHLDDSDAEKQASAAGEKAGSALGSKIGGALKATGAVIGAGVTAAAGAVASIGKEAVQSYAEFEQLMGGIETLYGDSFTGVAENSAQAFRTAGISANDYMEQAIQSGAALISSLEGDTAKAAELMDMAIVDMSDNVNKMGTDMEAVQNAYRGFSRGNFTMLDNLALGFAGTKEGMQELLDKAQEISGIKYDISSYADIVQAIHVVQEEMGIAGTTAKEANETISGSLNATKAAWENLVTGLAGGGDIEQMLDDLISSAEIALENLLPVVEQALTGIAGAVEKLAPIIAEKLPGLVEQILPPLITAAVSLVNALVQALPTIVQALAVAIPQVIEVLTSSESIESMTDAGIAILIALIEGITNAVPRLLEQMPVIIEKIVNAIGENLPKILDSGVKLIEALLNGIANMFAKTIEIGGQIVGKVADGVKQKIEAAKTWGKDLIQNFIDGILGMWNSLKETVGKVAGVIGDFLGFSEPEEGPLSDFHTYAPDMMKLYAEGIHQNRGLVLKEVEALASMMDFSPEINGFGRETLERNISYSLQATGGNLTRQIVVPVTLNGREIARATAWNMGEQLAWEEMS